MPLNLICKINKVFGSVTYRFGNTIIDPGDDWEFDGVESVLLTHAHFDHIYGLNLLLASSPLAIVFTNDEGRKMLMNAKKNLSYYHEQPFVFDKPENIRVVNDGEVVSLGCNLNSKVYFTPGHNPSCLTWIVGDVMFTGDSYIPGIKTVTNLPKGDQKEARRSEQLILKLAESGLRVMPGHDIKG